MLASASWNRALHEVVDVASPGESAVAADDVIRQHELRDEEQFPPAQPKEGREIAV